MHQILITNEIVSRLEPLIIMYNCTEAENTECTHLEHIFCLGVIQWYARLITFCVNLERLVLCLN